METQIAMEVHENELVDFLNRIEDGEVNALEGFAQLKYLEELYKKAKLQVEPLAWEEAEKHPDKSFSQGGYIFEKRNGGHSFVYKHIPEWQEKQAALKEVEERYKRAFEAKQKGLMVASEDAEDMIMPEITHRKSSLVVKK
jgi:hypothetical protein